jgi:predicted CoA-binding protein
MPDLNAISDFLAQPRLAFAGASRDTRQFANSVYRELRSHGHTMLPVHPDAATVEGDPAAPSVSSVALHADGVVVMLPPEAALRVVREAVDAGIPRVWLHRGIGTSAVSDEAVRYCRDRGVAVVDGACPLMFLPGAAGMHRLHRRVRAMRGAFRTAA